MALVAGWLLWLLHAIITLSCYIQFYFDKALHFTYKKSPPLRDISRHASSYPRIPNHVGILIVEEDISLLDVAKIVIWCFASGISHISVYDRSGYCKQHQDKLKTCIEECYQQSSIASTKNPLDIHMHRSSFPTRSTNGFTRGRSLEVILFSSEDGRNSLVTSAKSLSTAVATNQISTDCFVPEYIDSVIQERIGLPDPDLLLKFGEADCLMGYLPWQIRLSEIISHPTHHNIDCKSYYSLLHLFGQTKQRFGR